MGKLSEEYFRNFTLFVRDGLLKCGFPLCPADFMATNPSFCQPLSVWKKYFTDWIQNPTSESVLRSPVFFDLRALFGESRLLESLRDHAMPQIKNQHMFLAHIAYLAVMNVPPIGFSKSHIIEKNGKHTEQFNLKEKVILPFIDIVRLFALEKNISETSTLERIKILKDNHTIMMEYYDDFIHSFEFIMLLKIQHQFEQVKEKRDINYLIDPKKLICRQ